MPTAVSREQRIAFDALAFCINSIHLSYARLRKIALNNPPWDRIDIDDIELLTMLQDAWSIVDRAHTILCLCDYLKKEIDHPVMSEFTSLYGNASVARNKMDHLHQNINNLASMTKRQPPAHGAINYVVVGKDRFFDKFPSIKEGDEFLVVSRVYGAITHEKHSIKQINPAREEIEWPVGAFRLVAFEDEIDLSGIWKGAGKIEEVIEKDIKEECEKMLLEYARTNGIDDSKILERGAVGLHTAITMTCRKSL